MSGNTESRIRTVEEAMRTLRQLAIKESERKNAHKPWSSVFAQAQDSFAAERIRLARAQADLSEAQRRTEAVLAETRERLKALIDVVEKFISGQGGK